MTCSTLITTTAVYQKGYLGNTHRRQSLSGLASIQVADASVTLRDHVTLLGVILANRLSFDKHVSNVCSILPY